MEQTKEHTRGIRIYLSQRFKLNSVRLYDIGSETVQLIDGNGESMKFTCNSFGDILDAETGEVIARVDTKEPPAWTDSYQYFNKPKAKYLQIELSPSLHEKVEKTAAERGLAVSEYIQRTLEKAVKEEARQ